MRQLKDYYWGQNIYRIKQHILYDRIYEDLFNPLMVGAFLEILIGTSLLENGKKLQR